MLRSLVGSEMCIRDRLNEAMEVVQPTFIRHLVNRIVEVHTEVEQLCKSGKVLREDKAVRLQQLLLGEERDLHSLLGAQGAMSAGGCSPSGSEVNVPAESMALIRLATDLQILKSDNTLPRVDVDQIHVQQSGDPPSAILRITGPDLKGGWNVKIIFPEDYPHQPPEFSHDDLRIVSIPMVESWNALNGLQPAVVHIVAVLEAGGIARYPYDFDDKDAPWMRRDLDRVGRERRMSQSKHQSGRPSRQASDAEQAKHASVTRSSGPSLFGDSSDSEDDVTPFRSSKEAEAALEQFLGKSSQHARHASQLPAPKPPRAAPGPGPAHATVSGRRPTQASTPAPASAPAPVSAEGSGSKHQEAELRKLGYMKLKRLLLAEGISKKEVDAQFGVEYLLLLAKQKGIC
eukprot:TRINITY_DN24185_c0_g1_i2.p1 TRINITY_DN24185_c0_g1~~TRINITY_DN24185_c0_g1_i2.p1  ORF type:complete len:402 (-),score=59.18 TRINITY_DN24185_c0_g1_i2:68-1273(-)